MTDQAKALRQVRSEPIVMPERLTPATETEAIVVGSGKGGAGKSLVSLTMAAALADQGHRVLLVDGDQNLGNLHVLLGVRPTIQPSALLDGNVDPADLVVSVAPGLWLMPAASGDEAIQRLSGTDRARLHRRVTTLYPEYDVVVIDAAAGLDSALRCAALRATRLVVITTPEPTALTSAYALVKMVHARLPRLPVDLMVNRTVSPEEGQLAADRLQEAATRFLGRQLRYLGAVPEDSGVRGSLANPAGLVDPASAGPAQARVHAIVREAFPDLTARTPALTQAAAS
ncbi:MAG: AAA family ATPase [Gemmatimonadota bacterium]|nr:AAA family ATPase [Gemmatimonadota bacterium]